MFTFIILLFFFFVYFFSITPILAAIEKGEQEVVADSENSIIVVWLNMWIHAVDNEIQELTYQRMTPAEKEAHDQSVEDWKKHIEELRKKHGR